MTSRLITPKAAAELTTLSRPLLFSMAEEGLFPKPVRLTPRRLAFVRDEVEAWIDARIGTQANDNADQEAAA